MLNVALAFDYSKNPLVLSRLKEWQAYPVDICTHARLGPAAVAPGPDPPTLDEPLDVALDGAQMIEIVPIDKEGAEGVSTYVLAYALIYIPLPAVPAAA